MGILVPTPKESGIIREAVGKMIWLNYMVFVQLSIGAYATKKDKNVKNIERFSFLNAYKPNKGFTHVDLPINLDAASGPFRMAKKRGYFYENFKNLDAQYLYYLKRQQEEAISNRKLILLCRIYGQACRKLSRPHQVDHRVVHLDKRSVLTIQGLDAFDRNSIKFVQAERNELSNQNFVKTETYKKPHKDTTYILPNHKSVRTEISDKSSKTFVQRKMSNDKEEQSQPLIELRKAKGESAIDVDPSMTTHGLHGNKINLLKTIYYYRRRKYFPSRQFKSGIKKSIDSDHQNLSQPPAFETYRQRSSKSSRKQTKIDDKSTIGSKKNYNLHDLHIDKEHFILGPSFNVTPSHDETVTLAGSHQPGKQKSVTTARQQQLSVATATAKQESVVATALNEERSVVKTVDDQQ